MYTEIHSTFSQRNDTRFSKVNLKKIIKNNHLSPKYYFLNLIKILNKIVTNDIPSFRLINSEVNQFVQKPSPYNFDQLIKILERINDEKLKEITMKLFSLYPLLLNISIKAAIIHSMKLKKKSINEKYHDTLRLNAKMDIGLYAKETEPASEELILALLNLSNELEANKINKNLADLMYDVWVAAFSNKKFNESSMQLFYADQIYWNFEKIINEIKNNVANEIRDKIDLSNWLKFYTWLTTDRDGRPHDTNEKTIELIELLEYSIRENYIKELKMIYIPGSVNQSIASIVNRLSINSDNSYSSPDEFIYDLKLLGRKSSKIDTLIIKVNVFGFHYLKLEFRDNSKMINEVIDSILPASLIKKFSCVNNTTYSELDRRQKINVLTELLHSENEIIIKKIKQDYYDKNCNMYEKKSIKYRGIDYINLMDADPEYIRQVNVFSTIHRLNLMATYSDRIHVHAIAETAGPEDAIGLLFLAKVSNGNMSGIDIALQPEDSHGAITIIDLIHSLYTSPIYKKHLEDRDNKQYIVFGPSDTGKQGGKAMHFANMHIAKIHKVVAKQYDIQPIIHVIVGNEHARCNGALNEILHGYGTLNQDHSQYMMAGLNEMRSHLLSDQQVINFFDDLFFTQANYTPASSSIDHERNKSSFWLAIVTRYQKWFHNHPMLPNLLRLIARFDIINATAKGTRPPSRILNTKCLESNPSAIRAIPWSRAFLLAGIHSEVIGAGHLASLPAEQLRKMYLCDIDLQRYTHHIAYGVARTDMSMAWETSGEKRLTEEEISWLAIEFEASNEQLSPRHMLAWIDFEITKASCFVYKALYGITPTEKIDRLNLLRVINSALAEEVSWRNGLFSFYKHFLIQSRHLPHILKEKYVNDLFTGSLTVANTSLSMMYPKLANTLEWEEYEYC